MNNLEIIEKFLSFVAVSITIGWLFLILTSIRKWRYLQLYEKLIIPLTSVFFIVYMNDSYVNILKGHNLNIAFCVIQVLLIFSFKSSIFNNENLRDISEKHRWVTVTVDGYIRDYSKLYFETYLKRKGFTKNAAIGVNVKEVFGQEVGSYFIKKYKIVEHTKQPQIFTEFIPTVEGLREEKHFVTTEPKTVKRNKVRTVTVRIFDKVQNLITNDKV